MAVVTMFAADFAPRNWALCNGQILSISTNNALFALLGTTYGGNGTSTFGLPNLQGRSGVGAGTSPGVTSYVPGQLNGAATVTLVQNNLPPHIHNGNIVLHLDADSSDGGVTRAVNTYPANSTNAYATTANTTMAAPNYSPTIGVAGASSAVNIRSPFLALNHIICTAGIFPSRN